MIPSREEALFSDALARPAAERNAFLAAACADDVALLARVAALLAAHEGPESLMATSAAKRPAALPDLSAIGLATAEERAGDRIGRYKLLQQIGEGGCGIVYMAEQEEPVRRRVALKVIKLGMDTKAVVARFEAERQALAMMDHPHIAKVHDAGSTESGRPFFVMELVRGQPITKYCDEHQLTPADRLELFIKVCLAIQHAHQKGVIHRDIKPSNILVTVNDGQPTPKVIDFGIAKATQGRLTEATVFTAFEQFIGTPAYMSPEQAEMSSLDIDTRSDIYSLGVLLYELLTGRPPFDPKKFSEAGLEGIRQHIRESEPPRPSARLSTLDDDERTTIARLRNTASAELSLILRGDLDWIVMRCIEKDRTRRYDTANGLAMDIQRYLRNEPVVARPPSTAYLLQKLIRRHRVGFAAAAIIAGVVSVGAVVSTWQAIRATRAEREQAQLRTTAEASEKRQSEQRARAERGEADARRTAATLRRTVYNSDMNIAQQALADGNLAKARLLLDQHRPQPGEEDIRGFEWRYLWGQSRSRETALLAEYGGGFGGVAVSPDGAVLATATRSAIELRALPGGSVHRSLPLEKGTSVSVLRFSPDGRQLLAASGPKPSLRRWSTSTWGEETPLEGARATFAVADGGKHIVAYDGQRLAVWNADTGRKVSTISEPITLRYLTLISRDWLAATAEGRTIFFTDGTNVRSCDLVSGKEGPPILEKYLSMITCLAVSPQGVLAVGDIDARVTLWNVPARQLIRTLNVHHAWMTGLRFSPDGSILASASADQTVNLHHLTDGSNRRLTGHEGEVWSIAFSGDGKRLVSGSKYDRTVRLWDVEEPVSQPSQLRALLPVSFDANQGLTCWSPTEGFLRYDLRSESRRATGHARIQAEAEAVISGWGIAPDLSSAAQIREGKVDIWNLSTGRQDRTLAHEAGRITTQAYSQNGEFFATAGTNSEVRLWRTRDWSSRSLTQTVRGSAGLFTVFSKRGTYLAVHVGGKGLVFDLRGGGPPIEFAEMGKLRIAFSPDETKIAVGSAENFIGVWDIPQRKEIATLRGHLAGLIGLDFSPDGRTLASCGNDNFVRLWSLEPLVEILKLPGLSAASFHTMFSPDGTCLAAATSGGRVQLWHAPSWTEIAAAEKSAAKPAADAR